MFTCRRRDLFASDAPAGGGLLSGRPPNLGRLLLVFAGPPGPDFFRGGETMPRLTKFSYLSDRDLISRAESCVATSDLMDMVDELSTRLLERNQLIDIARDSVAAELAKRKDVAL